jgi:hypothetical protein
MTGTAANVGAAKRSATKGTAGMAVFAGFVAKYATMVMTGTAASAGVVERRGTCGSSNTQGTQDAQRVAEAVVARNGMVIADLVRELHLDG